MTLEKMQSTVMTLLFGGVRPAGMDFMYFGQQAFQLVETNLISFVQQLQQTCHADKHDYFSDAPPFTTGAHVLMLGTPTNQTRDIIAPQAIITVSHGHIDLICIRSHVNLTFCLA